MNAIASRLCPHVKNRVTDASGLTIKNFVVAKYAERKHVYQRIARVAFVQNALSAYRWHTEAIAIVRDAGNNALQDVAISLSGFRVIEFAEANGIENSNRARAHGEDVAQYTADAGCGSLERLDEAGVVVGFDFKCDRQPITYVYDASVFAGTLENMNAFSGQLLQVDSSALIRAVFAPHHTEYAQLGNGGFTSKKL